MFAVLDHAIAVPYRIRMVNAPLFGIRLFGNCSSTDAIISARSHTPQTHAEHWIGLFTIDILVHIVHDSRILMSIVLQVDETEWNERKTKTEKKKYRTVMENMKIYTIHDRVAPEMYTIRTISIEEEGMRATFIAQYATNNNRQNCLCGTSISHLTNDFIASRNRRIICAWFGSLLVCCIMSFMFQSTK